MPKSSKLNENSKKKYLETDVYNALQDIKNGMSQREASKKYGIPRATLYFRRSDKFHNKISHGPCPILSTEEESLIKNWILHCQKRGFPLRTEDVQESVKKFLDDNPRKNPFTDNRPGRGWMNSFLKRHPDVSLRTPEGVTAASSNISENDLRKWFFEIQTYLEEKGYSDILQDPTRIFNGDETCFYLCPKNKKVLAERGSKNVYEVEHNPKVNITAMFTFSASGDVTPPLLIYPYKRLPNYISNSVPSSWGLGLTDNGWMDNKNFYEYMGNIFKKYLTDNNIKLPVLLFVDGHKTHLTYHTSQLCSELNIILVALYPNATRLMQPADVSAFRPLKNNWNKAVLEFRRNNPNKVLSKSEFAPVLKKAVDMLKSDVIRSGFRACGIFPWNPSAIDYTKCLGKYVNKSESANETVTDINPQETITYKEFESIIGNGKIQQLKELKDEEVSENLQSLKMIYQLFCEKSKKVQKTVDLEENSIVELDEEKQIEDYETLDLTTIPIVIDDERIQFDTFHTEANENICKDNFENIEIMSVDNENNLSRVDNGSEIITFQNIIQPLSLDTTDNVNVSSDSMKSYFLWPQTPARKGKRQTERLPFVLTSSTRKKVEREKAEKKIEQEKLKENRKLQREQKKQDKLKSNGRTMKNTNKTKKRLTKNNNDAAINQEIMKLTNSHRDRDNIEKECVISKKGVKIHLPKLKSKKSVSESTIPEIPKVIEKAEEQPEAGNKEMPSDEPKSPRNHPASKSSLSPLIPFNDSTSPKPYVPQADIIKRNLFAEKLKDENKIKIISDIIVHSNPQKNPFTNQKIYRGLCYTCISNISSSREGLRCHLCLRTYHITCARRISSCSTTFICC